MEPQGQPPPTVVVPLTQEEQANLEISRRKGKCLRLGDSDGVDATMSETLVEKPANTQQTGLEKRLSYKDKLTNAKRPPGEWMDWPDEDGDEDLLPRIEHMAELPSRLCNGPNVTFTKEEKLEMWQSWRKAIMVKPLHRSIGYTSLCNRAKPMWKMQGDFQAVNIGHGCFIFRFSNKEDYKRVLTEGLWNIGGYCIVVRQWTSFFKPDDDVVEKVITWVRFPSLAIWYFNQKSIEKIGALIGKVLRIDFSTKVACKG